MASIGVASGHEVREYSVGEEIGNSVTHGVGALLAVAAIVLCCVKAARDGGGILTLAAVAYSIPLFLEYLMSTLYHALAVPGAKRVFKVLDHCCIYLLIAGSYTPFCLVTLANSGGGALAAVVWGIAAAGIVAETFWVFRPRWVSTVIYLAMGWSVMLELPALLALLDPAGLALLVAGGLCYSVGCVFYVLKKVPYLHMVFHLFVLAGSVCQFLAIVLYVL
ncbi:MAG: hemolysin III family protein [Atopobiaceae bacterium]|jgi:hemolysin III|nr:hemolysin III family protein [Atopobiaceae bacterium]